MVLGHVAMDSVATSHAIYIYGRSSKNRCIQLVTEIQIIIKKYNANIIHIL